MNRRNESKDSPARRTVLYPNAETEHVQVRSAVFGSGKGGTLAMDIYRPPGAGDPGRSAPAVVLVAGFPDPGYERILGCKFKDTGSSTSWARLIAASGLVAITYENEDPVPDARALLEHIQSHAGALGIDASRIGLLATSGNVPLALCLTCDTPSVACAALLYGYMPDDAGSAPLAEAAATWRFANPFEGGALEPLRVDRPLFVGRAGRDEMPRLNATIDRFAALALARNLPVTLVNHPEGPHAFDLFHDSEATRDVIRKTLAFLQARLLSPVRT